MMGQVNIWKVIRYRCQTFCAVSFTQTWWYRGHVRALVIVKRIFNDWLECPMFCTKPSAPRYDAASWLQCKLVHASDRLGIRSFLVVVHDLAAFVDVSADKTLKGGDIHEPSHKVSIIEPESDAAWPGIVYPRHFPMTTLICDVKCVREYGMLASQLMIRWRRRTSTCK